MNELCDWRGVNIVLPLSHKHVAERREGAELVVLSPRDMLSVPQLSTRVHTIRSTPSQGSVLSGARMRDGVELCHSPPRRFSQPVVHNQESPLVSSYASCECASGLYSTQGILRLDSRSQGKRRRTE
eukprot:COSAG01_NODE_6451_length_3660_cov_3.438641_4_plen_126_part_01